MKTFCQYLFGALLAITMSFDASAVPLLITPDSDFRVGDPNEVHFLGSSNDGIKSEVNRYLSMKTPLTPLIFATNRTLTDWKRVAAPSYSTEFLSDANWTITPSGPAITGRKYLLVKDGNFEPYAYFFDLTSAWNGTDKLVLEGFWPGQGSISYAAIYAADGGTTLMLLGMALAGLGAARRLSRVRMS